MSLMAGYDLVIEVSSEALLKLIEANATIGGAPLVPPFELNIPLSGGSAHVIVADMSLTLLVGTNKFILTMIFQDSTITLGGVDLPNLSGSFTINTQLQLVPGTQPNQKVLSVDLASASVAAQFDAASQAAITGILPPGLTFAQFQDTANKSLTTFVQNLGSKSLQSGFTVLPGMDGQLSPLRFERLDIVQCIGNSSIALFGILLADHDGQGNASEKETTAITAGHDLCVSVSPQAFTRLQFCPAAAMNFMNIPSNPPPGQAALQALVLAKMPECCGGAGGIDTSGMTIKRFCPTFETGFINIDGSFDQSGFCYDATGTFNLQMTFQVSGSTLTASISQDHPTVHIDVPWYCWLAVPLIGSIFGAIGVIIGAIIDAIGAIVLDALNNFQGTTPGIPPQVMNLSGFSGATLSDVVVTPEGLTLEGNMTLTLPAARGAQIQLTERTITVSKTTAGSGVYHYQGRAFGGSLCSAEDFPFTEILQKQTVVCQVIPTLLGTPLRLDAWLLILKTYSGLPPQFSKVLFRVELAGSSGTVSLPVDTHFPLPLPSGTTVLAHEAQIAYSISGSTIMLSNVPTDGTYVAWLQVEATDPANVTATAIASFGFEGDIVQFGKGYDLHMERCRISFLESLSALSIIPQAVPRTGDLQQWLADFTLYVINSNLSEKQQILSDLQAQFGDAFQRAVSSSSLFVPRALAAGLGNPIRSTGPRTSRQEVSLSSKR